MSVKDLTGVHDVIGKEKLVETLNGAIETKHEKVDLCEVFGRAVVTAPQLTALEIVPRAKLLGDFYQEADLGFIYAPRGGGKTWLAMLIANARANNRALGEWPAGERPGKVLYIDGEMHAADTQNRARAIEMDSENLLWLHGDILFDRTEQTLNLGLREHQKAVTELCVQLGITEVILDNISSLVGGAKESDADDWREMILPWLLNMRRRKISVIVIHHAGRNGLMRGTSQREDAANWILKIQPCDEEERHGAIFTTTFEKLRADPRNCPPLRWELTTNPAGALHYKCEKHTPQDALIELIKQGVSSASDLADLLGVGKGTISKRAAKAQEAGLITKDNGQYRAL